MLYPSGSWRPPRMETPQGNLLQWAESSFLVSEIDVLRMWFPSFSKTSEHLPVLCLYLPSWSTWEVPVFGTTARCLSSEVLWSMSMGEGYIASLTDISDSCFYAPFVCFSFPSLNSRRILSLLSTHTSLMEFSANLPAGCVSCRLLG